MVDRVSPEIRAKIMASVRTKNTGPELAVRRIVHGLGYRFRLHRKDLPGSPDLVLPGRRKVIFVHGCYWHGHGCRWGRLPRSRLEYWTSKIEGNQARDKRNRRDLRRAGWKALSVWQCELRKPDALVRKLCVFLSNP
ncbi:MAG: DNA mismatch endonuclease Vsr [Rhodospirillaceae bacterium]|nr:DNA mismatch endonuclease Vsr [Rhodospirillaceae bacterium]